MKRATTPPNPASQAKTRWLAIPAMALALGLVALPAPAAKSKPKLLVQDLSAQGVDEHKARVLSSATCNAFTKAKKHSVLCGDDIRNLMRFGALQATFDSCNQADCYSSLGKAMKARFIVSGSVSVLEKTYVLSLSVFDTKKNQPAGRTQIKAESLDALHAQVSEAVSAVLKRR